MNRAARRHMLRRLEVAEAPLRVLSFDSPGGDVAGLGEALRGFAAARRVYVLPPVAHFKVFAAARGPRVVAGKGSRHRGVRGRLPPLPSLQLVDWTDPKLRPWISAPRLPGFPRLAT